MNRLSQILLRASRFGAFAFTTVFSLVSAQTCPVVPTPSPMILYTDVLSGPNSGGENNKGIFLSIFGKNLGLTGIGTTIKVFINNVEVDSYRYFGASRGRQDIQQITVQVGALGNPTAGTALPIRVNVNGVDSNTDKTFTVLPGNIYFVDNVKGVDTAATNVGGTFTTPFRTVQKMSGQRLSFAIEAANVSGAWGRVQAGDFIVMRGTGVPWTSVGYANYFLQTLNKSGCPITTTCVNGGNAKGPITIMGYPNEDVFINNAYDSSGILQGAIASADSTRILTGMGSWINIVNLRIESGNHDGAVNTQAGGNNWRVVNNELTAATAISNTTAKAGGIAGNGHYCPSSGLESSPFCPDPGQFFLGNYIHDVFNGPDNSSSNFENHGIYIDGFGKYDIAYNRIFNIRGGNGISMFSNGSPNIDNVSFHHNIIQNVGKHGINISDGSKSGLVIWNNVIMDTDRAGLRFNTIDLIGAKIYNNTFYNTNVINNAATGALMNDWNFSPGALDLRNNIFVPVTGAYYQGTFAGAGTISNNLWFNGTGTNPAVTYSASSLQADPLFVSVSGRNLRLATGSLAINAGTSAVSSIVVNDADVIVARPIGAGYDIGAYER